MNSIAATRVIQKIVFALTGHHPRKLRESRKKGRENRAVFTPLFNDHEIRILTESVNHDSKINERASQAPAPSCSRPMERPSAMKRRVSWADERPSEGARPVAEVCV